MVAEDLVVLRCAVARFLLEPVGEALVKPGAELLRDTVVCRVANQDVTYAKGALVREARRRRANVLALEEHLQGLGHAGALDFIRESEHRAAMEDLPLDRSTLERRALSARHPVESRTEQLTECWRDRELSEPGFGHPPAVVAPEQSVVDQHPYELFDEERVARSCDREPHRESGRQLGSTEQLADELTRIGIAERLQVERCLPLGVVFHELGASETQQENRVASQGTRHSGEEVEQRGLGPMNVVDEEKQRALASERLEEAGDRRCDLVRAGLTVGDADRLRDDLGRSAGNERSDPLKRVLARVLVADAGRLAHDLSDWPIGDALPVLEAAAGQDLELPLRGGEKLGREPRLADSGLAYDRREDAVSGGRFCKPFLQQRQLAVSPDHGHVEATRTGGSFRLDVGEAVGRQRFGLAFQLERRDWLGGDCVPDEPEGRLADQDLARGGGLLEPGGDVDRIARDERLPQACIACYDLTRIEADAKRDPRAEALLELGVQPREALLHLPGCPHRPQSVVLVCDGDAEYGHHGVSDELLDRPAMPLDGAPHLVEVAEHEISDGLGIDALPHGGRPRHVAEEEGGQLPALRRLGPERGGT